MSATTRIATLHTTLESPLGELLLLGDGERLSGVYIEGGRRRPRPLDPRRRADEAFAEARAQLGQYFAGERTEFELALAPFGDSFEGRVWRALTAIPYGATISYGELARRAGHPHAARAVGAANGRNPISIVVPCHRVIGADGTLAGYSGGLERKRYLLELEAARARPRLIA